MATAEFSKFADILSAALSQHHLLEFEIAQLYIYIFIYLEFKIVQINIKRSPNSTRIKFFKWQNISADISVKIYKWYKFQMVHKTMCKNISHWGNESKTSLRDISKYY